CSCYVTGCSRCLSRFRRERGFAASSSSRDSLTRISFRGRPSDNADSAPQEEANQDSLNASDSAVKMEICQDVLYYGNCLVRAIHLLIHAKAVLKVMPMAS